jgi:hypothetical protein
MAVNLSPVGGVAAQFFDNAGNVLTGGKLLTYAAGTTTPQTTYTTSSGNIAWSNPIILDAAGRVSGSGEIWLTDGVQYKFILRDSNDVLIATYDNVIGINSNFVNFTNEQEIQTATAGQTVFTLTTMQYSPGTNSLSVFVDGVNQYGPGAQYAYLETDSDTVTFVNGLHVGALVKFTTSQLNTSGAVDAEQVSYTPPFVNSVSTNVEAKLAQYVSFKDFGAVGNGITDDKAAVLAALQSGYIVDGGGFTYAIDGTCAPSSFVGLQNANFIQIGNNTATNFQTLSFVGLSNFFIDNVNINMGSNIATLFSDDGNSGLYVGGAAFNSYAENFKVTRVTVTGNGCGTGIHIRHAKKFTVENCLVHNRISGSNPDPTNDSQNGIEFFNCEKFTGINCQVNNLQTRLGGVDTRKWTRGILMVETRDCNLVACNASSVDQGFDFSGAYAAATSFIGNRRFVISDCVANDCFTFGFKFANVARDGLVVGCIANNTSSFGFIFTPSAVVLPVGLEKYNTQNIDVVGCKVVNVLGDGWSGSGAQGFRVSANANYLDYPRGIRFKDCYVADTQDTPTTDDAFVSDVALPTYSTTGYNTNIANTITNCAADSTVTTFASGISPNIALVTGNGNQSIPNNAWTLVNWNTNIYDDSNLHNTASNNTFIYPKTPGWYRVNGAVRFAANATGQRGIRIAKNGSDVSRTTVFGISSASVNTSVVTDIIVYLIPTDSVGIEVFQDSSGALNAQVNESHFAVERVDG